MRQLASERIHRAEALELHAVDRALLAELAARLERRMKLGVTVTDRTLYVSVGDATLTGTVERHSLA